MMDVSVGDASWTQQANPGQAPTRQTMVSFYDREVQSIHKTEAEGRPIFEMRCYIRKVPPGDKLVEIDRKATKQDFLRYSREYELYQKHGATPVIGTPLEAWAQVTRAQVAEWKALNIFTVEQLADLPDSYGHKIMGFQQWKQKAQAFLQAGKGQVEMERMNAELAKRDEEIARMKENEGKLTSLLESMEKRLKAVEEQPAPIAQAERQGKRESARL